MFEPLGARGLNSYQNISRSVHSSFLSKHGGQAVGARLR